MNESYTIILCAKLGIGAQSSTSLKCTACALSAYIVYIYVYSVGIRLNKFQINYRFINVLL